MNGFNAIFPETSNLLSTRTCLNKYPTKYTNFYLKDSKCTEIPVFTASSIPDAQGPVDTPNNFPLGNEELDGVQCKLTSNLYNNQSTVNIMCQADDNPSLAMVVRGIFDSSTVNYKNVFTVDGKLVIMIQGDHGKVATNSVSKSTYFKSLELPYPTRLDLESWNEEKSDFRNSFLEILKKGP